MALNEPRTCVTCGQRLPAGSKLTQTRIPREEAEHNGWTGEQNPDGALTVSMCLQCQINRSKNRKDQPSA